MSIKPIEIDLSQVPKRTNPVYLPLYKVVSRYLVLMGGGSSGKSVYAAQKLVVRCLLEEGHTFLVIRKVARTLRNSVYAEIKGVISDWGMTELFTFNESNMEILCHNGNRFIFSGLDDVEKLKSIKGITSVWIEEASELLEGDFRQLDIRMRGRAKSYKQIMLTFNPISITHWLKKEFFDKEKSGAYTLRTTYKDNIFLPDEDKAVLESFKDVDEYYYTVYCLGQWGVLGKTIYKASVVQERLVALQEAPVVLARGDFIYSLTGEQIDDDSIKFLPNESGSLTIYEYPMEGHPYVIGGDTAEGGEDSCVGQVRNNITWNQAAVYLERTDTDLYAKQMYCLGKYYNTALIGIESNFDLHPTKELERLHYPKQYYREVPDAISGKIHPRHGFATTKLTRPLIISKHVALVREEIHTFNDPKTLEEMLTFVRNQNGRPEAQEGEHDDLIMADAICLEIRRQQEVKVKVKPKVKIKEHWALTPDRPEREEGWLSW